MSSSRLDQESYISFLVDDALKTAAESERVESSCAAEKLGYPPPRPTNNPYFSDCSQTQTCSAIPSQGYVVNSDGIIPSNYCSDPSFIQTDNCNPLQEFQLPDPSQLQHRPYIYPHRNKVPHPLAHLPRLVHPTVNSVTQSAGYLPPYIPPVLGNHSLQGTSTVLSPFENNNRADSFCLQTPLVQQSGYKPILPPTCSIQDPVQLNNAIQVQYYFPDTDRFSIQSNVNLVTHNSQITGTQGETSHVQGQIAQNPVLQGQSQQGQRNGHVSHENGGVNTQHEYETLSANLGDFSQFNVQKFIQNIEADLEKELSKPLDEDQPSASKKARKKYTRRQPYKIFPDKLILNPKDLKDKEESPAVKKDFHKESNEYFKSFMQSQTLKNDDKTLYGKVGTVVKQSELYYPKNRNKVKTFKPTNKSKTVCSTDTEKTIIDLTDLDVDFVDSDVAFTELKDKKGKDIDKEMSDKANKVIDLEGMMFGCGECDREFDSPEQLEAHVKAHAAGTETVCVVELCGQCGEGFDTAEQLDKHSEVHNGEKIVSDSEDHHKEARLYFQKDKELVEQQKLVKTAKQIKKAESAIVTEESNAKKDSKIGPKPKNKSRAKNNLMNPSKGKGLMNTEELMKKFGITNTAVCLDRMSDSIIEKGNTPVTEKGHNPIRSKKKQTISERNVNQNNKIKSSTCESVPQKDEIPKSPLKRRFACPTWTGVSFSDSDGSDIEIIEEPIKLVVIDEDDLNESPNSAKSNMTTTNKDLDDTVLLEKFGIKDASIQIEKLSNEKSTKVLKSTNKKPASPTRSPRKCASPSKLNNKTNSKSTLKPLTPTIMVKSLDSLSAADLDKLLKQCGMGISVPASQHETTSHTKTGTNLNVKTSNRSLPVTPSNRSERSSSPQPSTSKGISKSVRKRTARKSVRDQVLIDKYQLKESQVVVKSLSTVDISLLKNPHSPFGKSDWLKHKFDSETDSDAEFDIPLLEEKTITEKHDISKTKNVTSISEISQKRKSSAIKMGPASKIRKTGKTENMDKIKKTDAELLEEFGILASQIVVDGYVKKKPKTTTVTNDSELLRKFGITETKVLVETPKKDEGIKVESSTPSKVKTSKSPEKKENAAKEPKIECRRNLMRSKVATDTLRSMKAQINKPSPVKTFRQSRENANKNIKKDTDIKRKTETANKLSNMVKLKAFSLSRAVISGETVPAKKLKLSDSDDANSVNVVVDKMTDELFETVKKNMKSSSKSLPKTTNDLETKSAKKSTKNFMKSPARSLFNKARNTKSNVIKDSRTSTLIEKRAKGKKDEQKIQKETSNVLVKSCLDNFSKFEDVMIASKNLKVKVPCLTQEEIIKFSGKSVNNSMLEKSEASDITISDKILRKSESEIITETSIKNEEMDVCKFIETVCENIDIADQAESKEKITEKCESVDKEKIGGHCETTSEFDIAIKCGLPKDENPVSEVVNTNKVIDKHKNVDSDKTSINTLNDKLDEVDGHTEENNKSIKTLNKNCVTKHAETAKDSMKGRAEEHDLERETDINQDNLKSSLAKDDKQGIEKEEKNKNSRALEQNKLSNHEESSTHSDDMPVDKSNKDIIDIGDKITNVLKGSASIIDKDSDIVIGECQLYDMKEINSKLAKSDITDITDKIDNGSVKGGKVKHMVVDEEIEPINDSLEEESNKET